MSLNSLANVHTITVQQPTVSVDETGGVVRGYAGGTTLTCRVVPLATSQQVKFARDGLRLTHAIYFTTDPGLTRKSKLVFQGRSLEVEGIKEPDEGAVTHLRHWVAYCAEESQQQ